ncbi:alginate lyase family protein [Bacteroides sp. 51]|uniref:alginate lyase family protein n=1 Tax=Bacteroides sp. 51 TaxID=2302938 RepID=UPI0013D3D6AD|nr:alginate lyase family protein [Bacteroides sp. 51]NDV83662.1 cell wall anchor protein [Bacteroides sp. 51]
MKIKNLIIITGVALLMAVQTSCRENEFGTVDLTMPEEQEKPYEPVNAQYTFNHPCAMFNEADFTRVKTMLDNGTAPQPVKDEFQKLKDNSYAMHTYQHTPQTKIVRGDVTGTGFASENYGFAMRDAAAAYQKALLWKLTGDAAYANESITIMNDWAKTCTEVTSNDSNHKLAAGCQGYTFANAAEIMQTYNGWNATDLAKFKEWMVNVFASKNKDFLDNHQGANNCAHHYWSNWDLVNMCSYLAIGILTENNDMVNYVVNYFYAGAGNGSIKYMIQGTHTDPLGTGETICQNQESGRDQGHASMSVAVVANLCQMAYTLHQGNTSVEKLDFFSAESNAILGMGEYTALFNLKNGTDNANSTGAWLITADKMPFDEYKYCTGCSCTDKNHGAIHTSVADDTGRGGVRPGWEILYNHYAKVKGLSSGYKYAKQLADKMRPEGGSGDGRYGGNSGAFDQLGWGTLMMYRE